MRIEKNVIKMAKKKEVFHITITAVVTPYLSAGYKRIEENNAEVLLRNVIALIAKNLVGEDAHLSLVYIYSTDKKDSFSR